MMRYLLPAAAALLSACGGSEPLTQTDREAWAFRHHAAQMCIRRGQVTNPDAVSRYMSTARSQVWKGADQAQVDAAFKTAAAWPVSAGDCRELEFTGQQWLQEDAERKASEEQFSRDMDELASQHRTTVCNAGPSGPICQTF